MQGLNTAEPVLQLENYVFRGKYEGTVGVCIYTCWLLDVYNVNSSHSYVIDILGTCLVFKQDENGKKHSTVSALTACTIPQGLYIMNPRINK